MPPPVTLTVENGGWKPQGNGQTFKLAEKVKGLVNVRFDVLFGTVTGVPLIVIVPPMTEYRVPSMVILPRTLEPPKNPPTPTVAPGTQGKHPV